MENACIETSFANESHPVNAWSPKCISKSKIFTVIKAFCAMPGSNAVALDFLNVHCLY